MLDRATRKKIQIETERLLREGARGPRGLLTEAECRELALQKYFRQDAVVIDGKPLNAEN
jgi:hypothetical protein